MLGLSPRLRGNPVDLIRGDMLLRSIPAPAGEPCVPSQSPSGKRVYPRACGGTANRQTGSACNRGLSPRLRGNRDHDPHDRPWHRSIPAPAGEPSHRAPPCPLGWVYPRACGGTPVKYIAADWQRGLSPRLRGNRIGTLVNPFCQRSIPAPAGEPCVHIRVVNVHEVYPRACGGTRRKLWHGTRTGGLSPRLRGNLIRRGLQRCDMGSIPAPAGEPSERKVR